MYEMLMKLAGYSPHPDFAVGLAEEQNKVKQDQAAASAQSTENLSDDAARSKWNYDERNKWYGTSLAGSNYRANMLANMKEHNLRPENVSWARGPWEGFKGWAEGSIQAPGAIAGGIADAGVGLGNMVASGWNYGGGGKVVGSKGGVKGSKSMYGQQGNAFTSNTYQDSIDRHAALLGDREHVGWGQGATQVDQATPEGLGADWYSKYMNAQKPQAGPQRQQQQQQAFRY